jgi:hypothetical protein
MGCTRPKEMQVEQDDGEAVLHITSGTDFFAFATNRDFQLRAQGPRLLFAVEPEGRTGEAMFTAFIVDGFSRPNFRCRTLPLSQDNRVVVMDFTKEGFGYCIERSGRVSPIFVLV